MFSPDGDQGYPGAVDVTVRYELRAGGGLHVDLVTKNVGAVSTVTNMTLHPYFDLSGNGGVMEGAAMTWTMHAPRCGRYLPLDANCVPTGEVASVSSEPFDFRTPRAIGLKTPASGGFDSYFVADGAYAESTAQMALLVSILGDGVRMEVVSNQAGFQLYTSNGFDGSGCGKFARHGSVAVEPSGFIDATNHGEAFPPIWLASGQTRVQSTTYVFTETADSA
jgi:aldose 1-epimerase